MTKKRITAQMKFLDALITTGGKKLFGLSCLGLGVDKNVSFAILHDTLYMSSMHQNIQKGKKYLIALIKKKNQEKLQKFLFCCLTPWQYSEIFFRRDYKKCFESVH